MKRLLTFPILVVFVFAGACSADDGDAASRPDDAEVAAGEEVEEATSFEEFENRVRQAILLDGQELNSTISFDTQEAVDGAAQIVPIEIAGSVEVGDFYLVFTDTQVLYRPSADRVVQTVAVLRSSAEAEIESAETDPAAETDVEQPVDDIEDPSTTGSNLPDDLEEIPAPEPVPDTIAQ